MTPLFLRMGCNEVVDESSLNDNSDTPRDLGLIDPDARLIDASLNRDGGNISNTGPDACIPASCEEGDPLLEEEGLCLKYNEQDHWTMNKAISFAKSFDFNRDGLLDLFLVTNNGFEIYTQDENFRFTRATERFNFNGLDSQSIVDIQENDFDQDGLNDFIFVSLDGTYFVRRLTEFNFIVNQINNEAGSRTLIIGRNLLLNTENGNRLYSFSENQFLELNPNDHGLFSNDQATSLSIHQNREQALIHMTIYDDSNRLWNCQLDEHNDIDCETILHPDDYANNPRQRTLSQQGLFFPKYSQFSGALLVANRAQRNQMWIRNGNNQYEDRAPELGLQDQGQSYHQSFVNVIPDREPAIAIAREGENLFMLSRHDDNNQIQGYENFADQIGLNFSEKTVAHLIMENGNLAVILANGAIHTFKNLSYEVVLCD